MASKSRDMKKAERNIGRAEGEVEGAKQSLDRALEALENARTQLNRAMSPEDEGVRKVEPETPWPAPPPAPVDVEKSWTETCPDCKRVYTLYPGDESLNSEEGCEKVMERNVKRREPAETKLPPAVPFTPEIPNPAEGSDGKLPTLQSLHTIEESVRGAERYFLFMWVNWKNRATFYGDKTTPEEHQQMKDAAHIAGDTYFRWKVLRNQVFGSLKQRGLVRL